MKLCTAGVVGVMIAFLLGGCASRQVSPEKLKAATLNVQLGMVFLDKNDMTQAKKKLLCAKQQAPSEPAVWYGMGYFLERTGELKLAEQHYRHALGLNAARGASLNNYGAFLCRQGRYSEALEQFEAASRDPSYLDPASALANAGRCALIIPSQILAKAYFKRAIAKDPTILLEENNLE
jgi:type IV pilus assembly protein PilF